VVPAVIAIAPERTACCQPDALSPMKFTVPRLEPPAVQRLPTCVPVFCAYL